MWELDDMRGEESWGEGVVVEMSTSEAPHDIRCPQVQAAGFVS